MQANPYNDLLQSRRGALRRAGRSLIAPGCGPAPELATAADRHHHEMIHTPFISLVGFDQPLIQTLTGRKLVYEFYAMGTSLETFFRLWQGKHSTGVLLLSLTNFAAFTPLYLPFSGSDAQPHFEIDDGQPFTLEAHTSPFTGFLKYRIEHAHV